MPRVSEIKLIRTDTTLDLSQKAEKVCSRLVAIWAITPAHKKANIQNCDFAVPRTRASLWTTLYLPSLFSLSPSRVLRRARCGTGNYLFVLPIPASRAGTGGRKEEGEKERKGKERRRGGTGKRGEKGGGRKGRSKALEPELQTLPLPTIFYRAEATRGEKDLIDLK